MAPEPTSPADPHVAATQELLVRYLEVWTPLTLHRNRRVTYAESPAECVAGNAESTSTLAMKVFAEDADLLDDRELTMVLVNDSEPGRRTLEKDLDHLKAEVGHPAGLRVRTSSEILASAVADAFGSPIFALLPTGDLDAVRALGAHPSTEVLLTAAATRPELRAAGYPHVLHVELVAGSGNDADNGLHVLFATKAAKSLEKMKDALWAVDEYAGIRYRDPVDEGRTLLEIRLNPDLAPLRRALLATLAMGESSVAELQSYALAETIYQPAHALAAIRELADHGDIARTPSTGRLTRTTVVSRRR